VSADHSTGRVAVITGASSGIGEATARAMAADGHRVALLARRADRIEALADELGNGAIAIEADVTDRDSIVAAAERVQQELGGADILVNNAGVMLTAPFTSDQREEHRRMVETNLLGAMTATEGLPRPAPRQWWRRSSERLLGRRSRRPGRLRRLRGDQVGDQRLVGSPARRAATRHPGHRHRARRP
jgi:NAD(P)-dependent dehydrogenase (short-subunit alcohol dehydrogenase family)